MLVLFMVLLNLSFSQAFDWDEVTPLDEYVWREYQDDPYTYNLYETFNGDGYVMYSINLTSQKWMDETIVLVEDTLWRHWMTVVVPDSLSVTDAALVYIHGGNKNSDPPNPEQDTPSRIVEFALRTGAVAASINNIPHQPITFTDDMLPRVEDDIIARTWRYLIEGVVNDTDVNLLFPMTRAAS